MVQLVGAMIPVFGVAQISFDLVEDGVEPGGNGMVVLLDDVVRGVPIAGEGEFHGFQKLVI